jgi:hypothetical protein
LLIETEPYDWRNDESVGGNYDLSLEDNYPAKNFARQSRAKGGRHMKSRFIRLGGEGHFPVLFYAKKLLADAKWSRKRLIQHTDRNSHERH